MSLLRFIRAGTPALAALLLFAPLTLAAPAASYADASYSWTAAGSADASYNWSGYVSADPNAQYTAVSGSWVVPAVSAQQGSDLSADAAWVGIGGVVENDLIQAGTQALVDAQGDTQYEVWYETLPDASKPVPLAVSAGDKVDISLTQTSPGQWRIAFADNTTGKEYEMTVPYDSSLSSAEWIQEMPSSARGLSLIPLDNFNTVAFSLASAVENGTSEDLSQAHAQALAMVNLKGQTLAEPSSLSSTGDGFAVMRTDASATEAGHYRRTEILQQRL